MTESLILISVLLGPLAAMLGISACDPFTLPHWLPSAVFGTLTAVYILACFVLDSRRYFIAAGATSMALIYGLLLL